MANSQGQQPPAWLDKDLIQKILRSGDGDENITVISCEISKANAQGDDGYLSNMYRVVAKLHDSQERRMIAKCQPLGGHRESLIGSIDAYGRETRMISEIVPAMYRLLEQAKLGKYPPLVAKCLFHDKHPVPFIIMEDLRQLGYTLAIRQQGLDVAHCSMALRGLARFHASSIALYDQDPEAFESYNCPVRSDNKQLVAPFYESAMREMADEVSKWPGHEKLASKLNNLVDTVYDRVVKIFKRKEGEFNVLCHGDPWTTNMMFKYSGDFVEDIRFLDLQTCYFTSPAIDLHYFFFSCPSEEVRIKHMDELLQEYHKVLTETLHDLGCAKHLISLQQLQKMFDDYDFYGFVTAVSAMPIALSEPEHGWDVEGALSENDASGKNVKLYSNPPFVKAMKRLLPLFDKKGLLD